MEPVQARFANCGVSINFVTFLIVRASDLEPARIRSVFDVDGDTNGRKFLSLRWMRSQIHVFCVARILMHVESAETTLA